MVRSVSWNISDLFVIEITGSQWTAWYWRGLSNYILSISVVNPKVSKATLVCFSYGFLFCFVFKKMCLELKLFVRSFCNCFPETGITSFLKIRTVSFLGNTSSQILEKVKLWEKVKNNITLFEICMLIIHAVFVLTIEMKKERTDALKVHKS